MTKFYILIIIFFLTLQGCSAPRLLNYRDISNIDYQLRYEEVVEKLGAAITRDYLFELNKEGNKYNLAVIFLPTKDAASGPKLNFLIDEEPTSKYFMMFENNKYLFGGFEYQYKLYANDKTLEIYRQFKKEMEE